ncbi:MAG: HAD-IC family P-type ATPase, partial [Planctomycetaceae bacterium]|nr:HAD-IC family P-type ATPase [Planctomycetaceae bacterium]
MSNPGAEGPFWSVDAADLLARLGTSEQGLSVTTAAERLKLAQRLRPRRQSAVSLLLDQFKSPIMILLFCSAVLSLTLIEDVTNGVIILLILLASGLLGFWQEWSAADAVAKLLGMIETRTTLIRDGVDVEVPLDEVVAGDVVRLRAGDLIPGDCRLLTSRDLYVNEAVLTGESFPAEKTVAVLPAATSLGQRTNSLYLGTHVVSGMATA